MNIENDYSNEYKSLGLLTKALITGILIFAAISILIHYCARFITTLKEHSQTVFAIDILSIAIFLGIGRAIYVRRINTLKETSQTAKEKLERYRSILISYMAICEFPALVSIICFLLFGNFLFFIGMFMCLVEMVKKYPFPERIDTIINSGAF